MTLRIGINGLGRIGRCVWRALEERRSSSEAVALELVIANGPASVETHAHLLKYDSVHGRFGADVRMESNSLIVNNKRVAITHEKDPGKILWKQYKVDLVLECSGKFNKKEDAAKHNAPRVLISAPAEGVDATIVYGVNNAMLKKEHSVVSVGSCTTNALAPLAHILHGGIGIESGFMTTIHAYTGDQNLVDNSHKDLRRARSATMSMIPTSTGAAKTIGLIIPALAGKLDGTAIRVPVPNVSMVDLTFQASRDTTKEEVNALLTQASKDTLRGVLEVTNEKLVSIDFNHSLASSIADLSGTYVTGKRLVRVAAWYDNEWGFANRMLDVAAMWSKL